MYLYMKTIEYVLHKYQKLDNQELSTIIKTNEEGKAHNVFIKDFNRLMF